VSHVCGSKAALKKHEGMYVGFSIASVAFFSGSIIGLVAGDPLCCIPRTVLVILDVCSSLSGRNILQALTAAQCAQLEIGSVHLKQELA